MTIACGIQPTGAVAMAMKVLHNSCTCAFVICLIRIPLGFGHTYQIAHAYVTELIEIKFTGSKCSF